MTRVLDTFEKLTEWLFEERQIQMRAMTLPIVQIRN
jgi:hypothetical protein